MKDFIKKYVVKLLRKTADNIDAGNSELNEEQAIDIMSVLAHRMLSKDEACEFMNMSRSRFDDLVRQGKIPRGRKKRGFKELFWYEDELREASRH